MKNLTLEKKVYGGMTATVTIKYPTIFKIINYPLIAIGFPGYVPAWMLEVTIK